MVNIKIGVAMNPSDFYFQFCSGDGQDDESGISEDPYFLITRMFR